MGHSVTYLNRLSSTGFSHSGIETVVKMNEAKLPPKKPLDPPWWGLTALPYESSIAMQRSTTHIRIPCLSIDVADQRQLPY